jgi:glycerophosphoryl diester phosphodiesterase
MAGSRFSFEVSFVMLRLMVGLVSIAGALSPAQAFDLQGHRGARGLAPENTLPAFAEALTAGVTTLELDIAMTKDGVLVVSHDPTLNPDITRSKGSFLSAKGPAIRTLTLAEVKTYDVGRIKPGTAYARSFPEQVAADGTTIPTLAEVFELAGVTQVRFNVETKITPFSGDETPDPDTFVRALVETARAAGVLDRVTIQSFDWRTLQAARAMVPEMTRACLTSESWGFDTVQKGRVSPWTGMDVSRLGGLTALAAKTVGCHVWSPNHASVTQDAIRDAKAAGLLVIPWTVNERADAERLIGWGVDGLISDYPGRIQAILREVTQHITSPR